MNKIAYIFFSLFLFVGCHDYQEIPFAIRNNSEGDIIVRLSTFQIPPECFKPFSPENYKRYIIGHAISPNTSRTFQALTEPLDTLFVEVYHRADFDTLDCETFVQRYPIKRLWLVTHAKLDSVNWILAYP